LPRIYFLVKRAPATLILAFKSGPLRDTGHLNLGTLKVKQQLSIKKNVKSLAGASNYVYTGSKD
jgi:hypothetical protein